jgi:hypothetical protein
MLLRPETRNRQRRADISQDGVREAPINNGQAQTDHRPTATNAPIVSLLEMVSTLIAYFKHTSPTGGVILLDLGSCGRGSALRPTATINRRP